MITLSHTGLLPRTIIPSRYDSNWKQIHYSSISHLVPIIQSDLEISETEIFVNTHLPFPTIPSRFDQEWRETATQPRSKVLKIVEVELTCIIKQSMETQVALQSREIQKQLEFHLENVYNSKWIAKHNREMYLEATSVNERIVSDKLLSNYWSATRDVNYHNKKIKKIKQTLDSLMEIAVRYDAFTETPVSLSSQNFKSVICINYAIGTRCYRELNCPFAHGTRDQVELGVKKITQLCFDFSSDGFCLRGINCHFFHNRNDLPVGIFSNIEN